MSLTLKQYKAIYAQVLVQRLLQQSLERIEWDERVPSNVRKIIITAAYNHMPWDDTLESVIDFAVKYPNTVMRIPGELQ